MREGEEAGRALGPPGIGKTERAINCINYKPVLASCTRDLTTSNQAPPMHAMHGLTKRVTRLDLVHLAAHVINGDGARDVVNAVATEINIL